MRVLCRSGNVPQAVECYTFCIAMDPSQLAVYTNRAQAYLQLKLWDYAIIDCDTALGLLQQQTAAGA
jgi:tetratricopeptide (TPR) repeat protein